MGGDRGDGTGTRRHRCRGDGNRVIGSNVRTGIKELRSENPVSSGRQRKPGGGRKPLEHSQQDLVEAIDRLVEPTERGDPQSPLRWTCKSLNNLERELRAEGYSVGRTKISKVLRSLGYSLQGNRKTREGADHPDRNAQFEHIARRVSACRRGGRPARQSHVHLVLKPA